jgi:diacylglycerol kinase (ATP)
MKKKAIFIINLISGTSDKSGIPALIAEHIDHEKFDYEIAVTQYAGHASEIATKAKDDGVDVVVAVGGDGTVNEVARAIVHSNTALGIIPCGSGNGLARHLLLPINVRKSIDIINTCEIHDLDYGIINGYPFFCTCGMGFDAFVSMKFAEAGKRGPITYVENVLREGLKYKPETYVIPFRAAAVGVLQALFGAFHADGGLSAESHKVTLWLLARCGADGCLTCGTKT